MSSVGEDMPRLMDHIRETILPEYDAIPEGVFAATIIRGKLKAATEALASGDTLQILAAYGQLKDIKL